jgi:Ca2+-dependent lipid-binding protein
MDGFLSKSSDPFVELWSGLDGGEKYLTSVQKKNLTPTWNEEFLFGLDDPHPTQSLWCVMKDYDDGVLDSSHDFMVTPSHSYHPN